MKSARRLVAGLCLLTAACAVGAQESPDLKDGLRAVLKHGDLLDISALSKALGLQLYLPADDKGGSSFSASVTRVPASIYGNGVSYEVNLDQRRQETRILVRFVPRSCSGLNAWAKEWQLPVEPGMLTDGAGFTSTIRQGGPRGVVLSATYQTGGFCSYTLMQMLGGIVMPRFTQAPDPLPEFEARFEQKVAELVKHGDLRDQDWTAKVLNADFVTNPRSVLQGRLYFGGPMLAQIIPGVTGDGFHYSVNDSGWVDFPSFGYEGKILAARSAWLSIPLDDRRVCVAPEAVPASLERAGLALRRREAYGITSYEVDRGENRISVQVSPGRGKNQACAAYISLQQTTDVSNSVSSPVGFIAQDALTDDHLSPTALRLMDLISERLQYKLVKKIRIDSIRPTPTSPASEVQAQARLLELLRAAFIERGVGPELIELGDAPAGMRQRGSEANVIVDVRVK